jgi:Uma2 family endonuclease
MRSAAAGAIASMAPQPIHSYTFEEYLELERKADFKSEYRAGQIVAMSGGSARHSQLSVRMIILLSRHANGCTVFDSNLRLYIEHYNESTYPDAMLICGELQYWNGQNDVVTNPTAVVEVSSPSTEKYDRATKSGYYRSVPSMQNILLVSQDRVLVECWTRQDANAWITKQYDSESDVLPLGFKVMEIYEGILTQDKGL